MELQNLLFRYGWDTRCRNLIPAQLLRPTLKEFSVGDSPALLDVGCGHLGLAAFLPEFRVVGVDVEQPVQSAPNFTFKPGNVTALPFPDRSFPVVSCVDVLEHLPLTARESAITEIVRVASEAILIACPHGEKARESDERFRQNLERHRRDIPDWLNEHQSNPYPIASEIMAQVQRTAATMGRTVATSLMYCEPTKISGLVRSAAARSSALYAAINLLFGALLPLVPEPGPDDGYRMILLGQLSANGQATQS